MTLSIERLKKLKKQGDWPGYLILVREQLTALRKEETWYEYLDLLDNALADAKQCANTDKLPNWDTAIAICDAYLPTLSRSKSLDFELNWGISPTIGSTMP